jgi:putative glutamine amidotransferase
MKKVGVTQRQLPVSATGEVRFALDERWSHFLWDVGIMAIALPNVPDVALSTAKELDLDGIILSGGGDLANYGGDSPNRDETERSLLSWAIEEGKPLLGVCRGMELVADVMGCTLVRIEGHVGVKNHVEGPLITGSVTCYHDWAIKDVPTSLVGLAWSGDVLEAFATPDGGVLSVMWHPEREWPNNPAATQLVQDHFGAAS